MHPTSIKSRLDAAVARHDLLQHPFYQAWSAGTLPLEDLRRYAGEYGAFIASIGQGWARVGEHAHAAEEVEHAELWAQFARALGTSIATSPEVTEVAALVDGASALFAEPPSALGALYAFEVQQPSTARSKLDGLRTHYTAVAAEAERYFEVHAGDYHESDMIVAQLEALSPAEQDAAVRACERTCRLLWDALSGVHSGEGC